MIYWDNQKFGQSCDIIWDRIKFSVLCKPDFALNSNWVKVHVSKWYRKCFWTMLRYGPIQRKNHASIVLMSLQISQGKYTLFWGLIYFGLRAWPESLKVCKKVGIRPYSQITGACFLRILVYHSIQNRVFLSISVNTIWNDTIAHLLKGFLSKWHWLYKIIIQQREAQFVNTNADPDLPFHVCHPRCSHPHPDHSDGLDYCLVTETNVVQRLGRRDLPAMMPATIS